MAKLAVDVLPFMGFSLPKSDLRPGSEILLLHLKFAGKAYKQRGAK
jgi:hypothetical protein